MVGSRGACASHGRHVFTCLRAVAVGRSRHVAAGSCPLVARQRATWGVGAMDLALWVARGRH
eukprot:1022606-Lingulodinium_polyedra.AAC.1